jgi:hypothetical protein
MLTLFVIESTMASKKNKGKYVDDHREEEEAEESMTTKMMMMATTPPHEPTTPHQRSRSLPRRNSPDEPALTMGTPPTRRMTPLEMTMGTPPTTVATTTTIRGIINSLMRHSIN